MKYNDIVYGRFIKRLNRFTAVAEINGREELVHVKNTGRCEQILIQGAEIALVPAAASGRKTAFDLVSGNGEYGWVNIDSTAPNVVAGEWLEEQGYDLIKPEYRYGASRIDFYMERGGERCLMEVKGCTFQRDGIGYFPDAPTERGIKHLAELSHAVSEGYTAIAAYVIPMNGVQEIRPNTDIHPEYAEAFTAAKTAGVRVLFLRCVVTADFLSVISAEYSR